MKWRIVREFPFYVPQYYDEYYRMWRYGHVGIFFFKWNAKRHILRKMRGPKVIEEFSIDKLED